MTWAQQHKLLAAEKLMLWAFDPYRIKLIEEF
jgi:hypothetical protein